MSVPMDDNWQYCLLPIALLSLLSSFPYFILSCLFLSFSPLSCSSVLRQHMYGPPLLTQIHHSC